MNRLANFLSETLIPLLKAVEKPYQERLKPMARREVMEALLWLHMGTEVGVFPESASRDFYDRSLLKGFFESLLSTDENERAGMERGKLYVAHSKESRAMRLELPRYAGVLLESAMRGEEIFGRERLNLKDPLAMRGLFQTLLLLYTRFAGSAAARSLTYSLSFATREEWNEFSAAEIRPDEVVRAEWSGSGRGPALVIAGYLSFWGYGARCEEAIARSGVRASMRESAGIFEEDAFRLKQRLAEILSWRINLRSDEVFKRFEEVRSGVERAVKKESRKEGVDPAAGDRICASIKSAFKTIGVEEPELVTA